MTRNVVLRTRVESGVAIRVRLAAERSGMSMSEWIGTVVQREVAHAGDADRLALRGYELLITLGYMLRALMIDTMGAEPAAEAIQDAAATGAEEAAADLSRAREL